MVATEQIQQNENLYDRFAHTLPYFIISEYPKNYLLLLIFTYF